MIFTLVSAAQGKLEEVIEEIKQEEVRKEEERKAEEKRAEEAKYKGTVVTHETFSVWKKKFLQELLESENLKNLNQAQKLTGKWRETNTTCTSPY